MHSGLISPTTGGKRRKRNVFLVAAAVATVALVLVVSLAARNNKRAFVEAVSEVKRDSGAAQLLTQERQPRTGTDYDDGGGGGESVREKVKLEDTVYSKFLPTGFNGTWVSGNEVRTRACFHVDVEVVIFNESAKIRYKSLGSKGFLRFNQGSFNRFYGISS